MSSLMWKSFNLCFSKFKCFPTISLSPPPAAAAEDADDDEINQLDQTNPTLFKNFNSSYDSNHSDLSTSKSGPFSPSSTAAAAAESSTDTDDDCVPDFSSAFASHRFFFSSPGSSNSIVELEPLHPPPPQPHPNAVVRGGVAVPTFSPDPFSDFRQSMLEMIEARGGAVADWEFLNELLLCYLSLNPGHTHKFIVGAFADVVVSLVAAAPDDDFCRKTIDQRHDATSQLSI